MDVRTEPCPSCGAVLTVDARFAAWCPSCNWNVKPAQPTRRLSTLDRIYVALGRRFGRRLYEERKRRPSSRPRITIATIVAFAGALAVYALAALLLWMGLVIVTSSGLNPIPLVIGVFFLLLAWVMRPRIPRLDEPTLGRADLPRLFAFLDRLADAERAPRLDGAVISPAFNAGTGRFGWRRRRVVFVGLPLFLALDPQERVAVFGHELGHGINGDPGRGLLFRGAVGALAELHDSIEPESWTGGDAGAIGVLSIPFRAIQLAMARLVLAALYTLVLLVYLDGQRAEYYSDDVGARLAGRDASVSALGRLHAAESVARMTWLGGTKDAVSAIVDRVRNLPELERERLARVERLEGSTLAWTHPPTAFRIDVLAARPLEPASVVLTHAESDAIDAELERYRMPMGRKIVDGYLTAIGG